MQKAAILNASDVSKFYKEFCALDGVTLEIRQGEIASIIGPNGAGKTTLINVLTGLLRPTAGKVYFKGQDISGIGPQKITKLGLARSFQLLHIFPEFTALEFVKIAIISRQGKGIHLFSSIDKDKEVKEESEEILHMFGLYEKRDVLSKNLPQGDKKLLDIASALALHPEIILLDEPTSGVSTSEKNRIMEILLSASERTGIKSIVLVEHDMDIVFSFSHRIIAIHHGKVLADSTPAELEKNDEVVCTVMGQKECFKTFSSLLSGSREGSKRK
ncbi:MAG: ABC transporter ATP-binding protein [Thermodesulfobacteriota bacterium]|jgi:branched-chain amino acid transport system ATP-binding protein